MDGPACVSLVFRSYSACIPLVTHWCLPSASVGISAALGRLQQACSSYWRRWRGRHAKGVAFSHQCLTGGS